VHDSSIYINPRCSNEVKALHSKRPSTATKPTLLHTCAASALLNDAPPRAAAAKMKILLVRWGGGPKTSLKASVCFVCPPKQLRRQQRRQSTRTLSGSTVWLTHPDA
jgi:hypothetical protein